QEGRSIVACILSQGQDSEPLTTEQHTKALDFLAIQLSIRDRNELVRILCYHQPDLLTSSVRNLVNAYDPVIRALHQAVDLSRGVSDLQDFLNDLISLARIDKKAEQAKSPSVEDFCRLLQRHQGSSHRFIHQVLKNGPTLSGWYSKYAAHAAAQYKSKEHGIEGMKAAGNFSASLQGMYSDLNDEEKSKVVREMDRHFDYLTSLTNDSADSMEGIIANLAKDVSLKSRGPGIYLAKWQSLMDATAITPETAEGTVRSGKSQSVRDATRVDTDGAKKSAIAAEFPGEVSGPLQPDVSETVRLLIPRFRESLTNMIKP
ncbi:MAG: hypothetical protein Q9164_002227, partial [Protoblastenia rupestris]